MRSIKQKNNICKKGYNRITKRLGTKDLGGNNDPEKQKLDKIFLNPFRSGLNREVGEGGQPE